MAERAHPEDPGFKDKCFGLIRNKYKRKLYERYKFCNKYIVGNTVLDIPCGVGWGTSLLRKARFVLGMDISHEAISYAKKHYENATRRFFVGGMGSISLKNNSCDVLICLEGFEHVSKDEGKSFIQEGKRILRKGGLLVMTCPVLNESGKSTGNQFHLYEYPESELIEILFGNFRVRLLERINGPEGPEYRAV